MTDTLLALVPDYGMALLFAATYFSCLALPIPASLLMLAGGAFAATGDLSLIGVGFAAFAGAVVGDQTGFLIGRWGGTPIVARLSRKPAQARLLHSARAGLDARGDATVFLTRWLFSPLGPAVNLAAGAMGSSWVRFTIAGVGGEAIWVGVYTGPGYLFADSLADVTQAVTSIAGLLAAGVLTIWLGRILWLAWKDAARSR